MRRSIALAVLLLLACARQPAPQGLMAVSTVRLVPTGGAAPTATSAPAGTIRETQPPADSLVPIELVQYLQWTLDEQASVSSVAVPTFAFVDARSRAWVGLLTVVAPNTARTTDLRVSVRRVP
jgi:hypothetical protein